MNEEAKPKDSRNMHATILAVLGIILVIVGAYIVATPGAPLRGSGVGTASIILGVILLFIAVIRYLYKRT